MESIAGSTRGDNSPIPSCWPHQVFTGLVFWASQEEVPSLGGELFDELARVVDESADVNTSQLVGTHDGEVDVPTYDWAGYLGGVYRKVKGIKKYHSFRFSAASHGIFFMKKTSDPNEPEEQCNILSKDYSFLSTTHLPPIEPGTAVVLVQQYSAILYS